MVQLYQNQDRQVNAPATYSEATALLVADFRLAWERLRTGARRGEIDPEVGRVVLGWNRPIQDLLTGIESLLN